MMTRSLKAFVIAIGTRLANNVYRYIDLGPRAHVLGFLHEVTILLPMLIVVLSGGLYYVLVATLDRVVL